MPGWVELHTHSNHSFLDGASEVDDLVDAAVAQGMDALALTDTNGLYGAVRFANAAQDRGLRPIFGSELQLQDAGHVELSDHLDPEDAPVCDTLASLAAEMGLGCVVTNNVHYARPEGRRLHDVLRCIDLGVTLDEAGNRLKPNGEYWLKGEVMLRERLGRFDEAFRNACAIADACVFELLPGAPGAEAGGRDASASFVGKDRLPGFPVPAG